MQYVFFFLIGFIVFKKKFCLTWAWKSRKSLLLQLWVFVALISNFIVVHFASSICVRGRQAVWSLGDFCSLPYIPSPLFFCLFQFQSAVTKKKNLLLSHCSKVALWVIFLQGCNAKMAFAEAYMWPWASPRWWLCQLLIG